MTIERIGVAGAGTMGAGIAQLAALGGYETCLHDPDPDALEGGAERLAGGLAKGVERGRWETREAAAASERVRRASRLEDLDGCELVIEAAPERLEVKRELFSRLESCCGPDAILATNTSSLPVSAIATAVAIPERVCGMHFFNPPPLMRLVEVVAGKSTTASTVGAAAQAARRMGRTPVVCADSPGFVVNRCNRPFTLESLRILDEGVAGVAAIDAALREAGGYRMGPFELMDLIGIDVNLEVARSFYAQRPEPRWRPHPIQERMVAEGRLGRKAGHGFYRYENGAAVASEADGALDAEGRRAVLERVVAALVNEACFAVDEGVAAPEDVDTAMRLGLNHPRGPFEWLGELGAARTIAVLDGLAARGEPERYRTAARLRSAA